MPGGGSPSEVIALFLTPRSSLDSMQIKPVEKEERSPLGPYMIGFFMFVVIGSALFQIIRTATRGSFADAE